MQTAPGLRSYLRHVQRADMMKQGLLVASRLSGRLAQLVRAPALQAGSRGFESLTAHHMKSRDILQPNDHASNACKTNSLDRSGAHWDVLTTGESLGRGIAHLRSGRLAMHLPPDSDAAGIAIIASPPKSAACLTEEIQVCPL
jgi:hypothetical protein